VSDSATETSMPAASEPDRRIIITALGVAQILAWGSSYYLMAVLAKPIADDTEWSLPWIVGGLSLGLLTACLVSPRIGRTIERHGGRPVLAASAGLLATGLLGLAVAPTIPIYLAAWLIMGIGMGAGLYDAAFGTLGRLYGRDARQAITTLTLFGGFASTVCWPLSAFLVSEFGWRGTCLTYAALQVAVVLPLHLFALPQTASWDTRGATRPDGLAAPAAAPVHTPAHARLLFVLLAATITLGSAVVSVHLLTILQARDIALAAAVALGALVGPSQVGARAIEMAIGRYHHPIWTMMAATVLVAGGIGALCVGLPVVSAALVFYGAGIGIESIARGTLPLALFGATGYAARMGRLAMPSLIAQATSPSVGAVLMDRFGASGTLAALLAAAVVDVMLVVALFICSRSARRGASFA
jgi:MFS family permease